eukprot:SAG31_NODE_25816_length_453_cov_1.096045_1_plen_102_part_10
MLHKTDDDDAVSGNTTAAQTPSTLDGGEAMAAVDWAFLAAYVVVAIGLEVYVHRNKEGTRDTETFFVAGRTLPWWVAGTSIVATTFSSDTPLLVAGLSRGGL